VVTGRSPLAIACGPDFRGVMDAELKRKEQRPVGRPRSDKIELIDSELLDGALAAFLRHGYGGTTLAQIIKALRISKTTLYSRYASKAELFQAIISQQSEGLSAGTVLHPGGAEVKLEEGLRAYAVRTLELSFEGELLQVNRLIYSESHRFPELGAAAAQRTEVGIRQIAAFIAECAVRDGVACRDPVGIATAFIFMLRGWYVNVMLTNEVIGKMAIRRFADEAVRAILSGREDW
jgi:TetR/AcrR family transcriptional repressor of mexJK operon